MNIPAGDAFSRRPLAFTCCLAMLLYAVYLAGISVLLPAVGSTFGLGTDVQGRLFPANFLSFFVVVLWAGQASDRWPRKTVLLGGILAYAVGLMLFSRAPGFYTALIASIFIGGGSGAVGTVSTALAADLYPDRRAQMLTAIQVAFGLGAALGPGIASLLLHHAVSWRLLYAGLAFANFVVFAILSQQDAPVRAEVTVRQSLSLASLLRQPAVLLLCLLQLVYAGAEVGFFSWMPTYFEKRLPGGAFWAGSVVPIFWIAMTIGRSLTGKLLGKLPYMRLCALLATSGAVFAALTCVWQTPGIVLVFVILTGLSFSGIFIMISSEAGQRYTASVGAVFGVVIACGGLGTAILPWLVGLVAAGSLGWRGGLAIIPIAALSVAGLALTLERKP